MTSIKAIKKSTTAQVDAVLKDVPKIIAAFESALSTHFAAPSPSELENAYAATLKSSPNAINTPLVSALSSYKDLLAQTIDNIQLFERFIVLHIPQMEDGNNFGVTVQMTVGKALKETRESLLKQMDSVVTYYNSRADAVEKLSLEKSTKTVSSTSSKTDSSKDEEKKESTTESTDVKTVSTESKTYDFRLMALAALDVNAYMSSKAGLVDTFNDFLMVVDNIEKNKLKLTSPKGSSGGNSMGMY
ncbi:hypothetical protein CTEN210_02073 [Chaetoceros tenuissimus]|uniref:Proteasome activator PA28 C-terminal domain-containing protein n=1 Tax=Chaetoceros tenuissimus TaxID=426638 RepID=A0AAD3CIU2_9STRA|nr:hypothetical protein CTEN210_02073 [Chaetoceros tenuissimus]